MKSRFYNQAVGDGSIIACPHCDLIQRLPDLKSEGSARCPKCGEEVWRRRKDSLNRTLALAIAAALLYLVANFTPMLGLSIVGRQASTTVIGGALHLWNDGREMVAALVFFTAVAAPALQIGYAIAIAAASRKRRPPRWVGALMRHLPATQTWSMLEVMLVGVLVALVKIEDYAKVIPGMALFLLGMIVVLFAAIQTIFDPREIWNRIEWVADGARQSDSPAADREVRT